MLAGESGARHRRDSHSRDADQCGRRVGAVSREEMAGVGACGQRQAADGASEREPDAAYDLTANSRINNFASCFGYRGEPPRERRFRG
jgi:hypothetical protein